MNIDRKRPLRIANLLPPAYADLYTVPAEVIDDRFISEVVTLAGNVRFINDLDRTVAGLHFVEAGIRAEAEGFDAIFLNTVGDYGLRDLRAAVTIPVVGAGQATFHLASVLADRFGVLTVWPRTTHGMYRRLIEEYGLESRCVGIRHVLADDEVAGAVREGGLLEAMSDNTQDALTTLVEASQDLIAAGAEAIALGCSCMAPIRDALQNAIGLPVVDPITASHKLAESLVLLRLTHASNAVRSHTARSIRAMITGVAEAGEVDDACGDACTVLAAAVEHTAAAGIPALSH